MGCEAQLAWKCLPIHAHFLRRAILTCKVGQTDLVLACDQGSLAGLCTQDYKSLSAAVIICSSLVNIQTHPHIQTAFWPAYMKSSASQAKSRETVTSSDLGCLRWIKSLPRLTHMVKFSARASISALRPWWLFISSSTPDTSLSHSHRSQLNHHISTDISPHTAIT